jgi:hypothetical protein
MDIEVKDAFVYEAKVTADQADAERECVLSLWESVGAALQGERSRWVASVHPRRQRLRRNVHGPVGHYLQDFFKFEEDVMSAIHKGFPLVGHLPERPVDAVPAMRLKWEPIS